MLLVCGGLAWFAGSRFVGKPIGRLMEQAHRIGSGDFSARQELGGADELTELAREMNAMAGKLDESRRALEAQNRARLEAIEQLRHADRLKTVGNLASGVAHELGTPLNVVSGRAQMIVEGELRENGEVVEAARVIRTQADRMARIVRQLLDFARHRKPEKRTSDLVQLARDAIAMLDPLARKRKVSLELVPPDSGAIVAVVDQMQIGQAVTNLLMNAVQATHEGSTVELRVGLGTGARPGDPAAAARSCACISVSDCGPGIRGEQLHQLFDPFFTTKDVGEGTGLGLSVAHGIVSEHGGWIEVQSEPGAGSSFRIWLPGVAQG
jgi:signal transduction histidine kinase